MRSSLIILASIFIMLIGLLGTAVIMLDENRIKALVVSQVERNTGRKVEILGSVNVRLFPVLRLQLEQVVLRERLDDDALSVVTAERIDVDLRLLPLIRGRVLADEVRVAGARLNLRIEPESQPGSETEPSVVGSPLVPNGLASSNVLIEDLSVNFYDETDLLRQAFTIEHLELVGFVLDQPVAFRFSGNFGEPPLFDQLQVDGRLISHSSGRFQLNDMRLVGSLEQGRYAVEAYGDLNFQAGAAAAFTLANGRLAVNEHLFELEMAYQDRHRPYVSGVLSGQLLEVDSLLLLEQLAMLPHDSARSASLAAVAGLDLDFRLDLGQVGRYDLILQDFTAEIRGRAGHIDVSSVSAVVPGGLLSGQASLQPGAVSPQWQIQAEIELAEAERLFDLLWQDSSLSGAGRLHLALDSIGRAEGTADLPWQGLAELALWDGSWDLLAFLDDALAVEDPGQGAFARLETKWWISPGQLRWETLQVAGGDWLVHGDLLLLGRQAALSGNMHYSDELGALRYVELGGRLARPELLAPPVLLATSQ